MLASTIDIGFPPAWNSAVMQIQVQAKADINPPVGILARCTYLIGNAITMERYHHVHNSIVSLGWTEAEALETYLRLQSFAEDWGCPEMEAYDAL